MSANVAGIFQPIRPTDTGVSGVQRRLANYLAENRSRGTNTFFKRSWESLLTVDVACSLM